MSIRRILSCISFRRINLPLLYAIKRQTMAANLFSPLLQLLFPCMLLTVFRHIVWGRASIIRCFLIGYASNQERKERFQMFT